MPRRFLLLSPLLLAATLFMVAFASPTARAEVRLPNLFSDHMLLQRDMPINIWGWAEPGEEVTVTLDEHSAAATADGDGRWQVTLPAMPAGGPYELTAAGSNKLTVSDILLGELWLCSGQSNMNMRMSSTRNFEGARDAADYPRMRLMNIPSLRSEEPLDDIDSQWYVCQPAAVGYFPATAFYFGRELYQELDVPVGIIVAAYDGTRIEPWTPAVGVAGVPELERVDEPIDGDIYNAMIHPLVPMSMRGVIWYQGEGNVGDGMIYYPRMRALIEGWREVWGQGEFPFYYVQVAPLNWGGKPLDQVPELWEAQQAALQIPNTGMAVTNDIGNTGNAHPKNKVDVGRRLALWAFAKTYGDETIDYSGPLYRAMTLEGDRIRIHFDYTSGGLASRDGEPLDWFTIADADGEFVPAVAEIEGHTLVVHSDEVPEPVAVRFGWLQTAEPNLMNGIGLPAPSFRTDPPE